MRSLLLLFGLILSQIACNQDVKGPEAVKTYRYLALGDSYSIGQGVSYDERWPSQLVDSMAERGIIIDSLKYIAQTGWTTNVLQNAIDINLPLEDFDMVSLLIGVNDQFQNLPFETFQLGFDTLLIQALEFAGSDEHVFVVSIPDYGVTPFGAANAQEIADEIDMYNVYILQKCVEMSIPFIDVTGISRQLGDSQGALAPDDLHPSGYQYGLWVNEIIPVVESLLNE